jgi:chaperonin GroEL
VTPEVLAPEPLSALDRSQLEQRLAALKGGAAVLHVGGWSEVEIRERRDRLDDALSATRAAIDEGVVAGGGSALLHASKRLYQLRDGMGCPDQRLGVDIVRRALGAPARAIAENAGFDGAVVSSAVLRGAAAAGGGAAGGSAGGAAGGGAGAVGGAGAPAASALSDFQGFDARAGEYGCMAAKGILDPLRVTKTALIGAASVAGLVLTTDVFISHPAGALPPLRHEDSGAQWAPSGRPVNRWGV